MLSKSGLRHSRSRTAFALALISGISLFGVRPATAQKSLASPAPAQTSVWTVKVDVSYSADGLSLGLDGPVTPPPSGGGCQTVDTGKSINGNLYGVCTGDTVKWKVYNGSQAVPKDKIVVFSDEQIFDSKSGDTVTDTGNGVACTDVISGSAGSTVKYYVAVWDGSAWHTQDPKIIMGSGSGRGPSAGELKLLEEGNDFLREIANELEAKEGREPNKPR
jgi:hypothetical protein